MFFHSKKAMSPLIATVLLIAFAVALGAMIMNVSAGMEPAEEGSFAECEGIELTTTQNICYANNALTIVLKNKGHDDIAGVSVHIENIAMDIDTTSKLPDSRIIPSETIEKTLPTIYPGKDAKIEVVPMVVVDGELEACMDLGFIQPQLVDCK